MTLQLKEDGSARLDCDCAVCRIYMLGPDVESVVEQASLEGWSFADHADPKSQVQCRDCARGECPGAARVAQQVQAKVQVAQQAGAAVVAAGVSSKPVQAGELVRDHAGTVVGVALEDAEAGALLLVGPAPQAAPTVPVSLPPTDPAPPPSEGSRAPSRAGIEVVTSAEDERAAADLFGEVDHLLGRRGGWNPDA